MQDRFTFRGMLRAAAIATTVLVTLAGCRTQQEVPTDANNPTDGPALIKLGDNDPKPDVGAAFARRTFYLDR
jgi:hypothetical protein